MDPTIFGRLRLIWEWYNWAVFVAFVLALGAVFWVFYDSQRRGTESILWKVIAVVSLILIIPSVILRIDPTLALNVLRAIEPLAFLGLAAGVASLVTLFAYSLGATREPARICPTCGRKMDPSWDWCPYCGPPPPLPPPPPPPPPGPIEETEPLEVPVSDLGFPPERPRREHTIIQRPESLPLAWLILRTGPRTGKDFPLHAVTNVGRDASENDVPVDDGFVSNEHARIRLEDGRFVLYDLATSNHTFVNGQQIQRQALLDGDTIRMGDTEFTFMEVTDKT